jgi:hypothetical protein
VAFARINGSETIDTQGLYESPKLTFIIYIYTHTYTINAAGASYSILVLLILQEKLTIRENLLPGPLVLIGYICNRSIFMCVLLWCSSHVYSPSIVCRPSYIIEPIFMSQQQPQRDERENNLKTKETKVSWMLLCCPTSKMLYNMYNIATHTEHTKC